MGADLEIACRAILDRIGDLEFDAAQREWFVVRKEKKGRGTNKLVESAGLTRGTRVAPR
jgi:hypothetical protein